MKYLSRTTAERSDLLAGLEAMPQFLEERLGGLSPSEAGRPGPQDAFSAVEQCWHLAELEVEGFGRRIARLLAEDSPALPDFDGARLARERRYASRDLASGLAAFREARRRNLAVLRDLSETQWQRAGTQEGVGPLMLCDVPDMMAQHDDAHRAEIEAWSRAR
jgi:hypothetical protein